MFWQQSLAIHLLLNESDIRASVLVASLFVPFIAVAELAPHSSVLSAPEHAALLKHAQKERGGSLAEVRGGSHWDVGKQRWAYYGLAYGKPFRASSGVCKAPIYLYEASAPRKKAVKWSRGTATTEYMVWLSEGEDCRGSPSEQVHLSSPIEEATLLDLLRNAPQLAKLGLDWIDANQPYLKEVVSTDGNQLYSIDLKELPEVGRRFGWVLVYRAQSEKGLRLELERVAGLFKVRSAGSLPQP